MRQQHYFQSQRTADAQHRASTPVVHATQPSRDEVAKHAYLIYLHQGCPPGHAVEHWLSAESQLLAG